MSDEHEHAISFYDLVRGTPVETSDGEQIGTVAKAQNNVREHIFDGIVIDTPAGRRFVDAPEVERLTNLRVSLNISAAEAAGLPEHRGMRGVMEVHAQRAKNRWKRRLGR